MTRSWKYIPAVLAGLIACGAALVYAQNRGSSAPPGMFPPDGPKVPSGLVPIIWPDDNPYTPAKAELGWLLFFDPRLSADGTVSCASCHSPKYGFGDGAPVSTGIKGQKGGRSAPTVINRVYGALQFWDGRAPSLEEQAKGPIANPIEMTVEKDMNKAHQACVECLRAIPGYRQRFKEVFGTEEFTIDHIAKAIATFERCVLSGNSPYDRYNDGDKKAMSESAVRGMDLFFSRKTRCSSCHDGAALTLNRFANVGIGMDKPNPDLGRYNVSKDESDKGAFKTPGLRDIANTAPYMHDGSLKTLEEVVEHYDKGGVPNPWLHADVRPLKLTVQEKKDLVEFMKSLSGEGWQHLQAPKELPK